MDPSDIIPSTGKNPSPPTSPRLLSHFGKPISTRPNNKDSSAKIHRQSTHPTTFLTDPPQFRSVVEILTGIQQDSFSKHFRDMVNCISSLKNTKNLVNVFSQECLDCLLYCSLFSQGGYEIESNTLIQLWMAAGLVTDEPMEEIGAAYLEALKFRKIISVSREEHNSTGKIWFKVNDCGIKEEVVEISKIKHVRVDCTDPNSNCDFLPIEPCHVAFKSLPNNLEMVRRHTQIRAFLMLRGHESSIDCLPYDFFIALNHLQALDLSGSRLMELPNSVGNARCLRYLDLSETRIKQLPKTIESLENLQTLKLNNCPNLIALPKGTKWLTSLRHLDLGRNGLCRLQSMPPGIGSLTSLRTLPEFVVGRRQNGCGIGELKNMVNLQGKLCLSKLEHVESGIEAKEANLWDKRGITKLELRWSSSNTNGCRKLESIRVDQEIIDQLYPPPNIKELKILCYGGSIFPIWISHLDLEKLVSITLFKCENCQFLPSLGELPYLESLSLIELIGMEIIDLHFCRDIPNPARNQVVAFPRLKKLGIKSMVNLVEWRDSEEQDFPGLIELSIKDCPKLTDLCRLSNMKSLEYLEINHCGELQSLPVGDLPSSVKTLVIEGCPLLRISSSMEDAQNWRKTEHSPGSLVYQRQVGEEGI